MQNFTEEIKNEIISLKYGDRKCAAALLSAFIRTSGSLVSRENKFGFEIVTESERTAEFICGIIETVFGLPIIVSDAKSDLLSGKDKLTFECVDDKSGSLLRELKIMGEDGGKRQLFFGIDDKLTESDKSKIAYVKGAFLGGGSCTLPDEEAYSRTGYHFEIIFSNKTTASDFCDLLCGLDILAKLVSRKDSYVVYVKSKEVISDILNLLECNKCLEKLNKIAAYKDTLNNANRVNNCSVYNIDKTVTASVKQVQAINVIAQTIGLQSLNKNLFDVAECRLADTKASMQELAERLNISKSCLNHRMRRILEIAEELRD